MEKTEKEIASDDEPKYRGIKAMPFVIGNETFEKLGTIGTASNLLVYLTSVFQMTSISATNLVNIFNATCNFGTLAGAFLCDTYFGRYKTLGFASICSFLGMLVLALTAAISKLHPAHCSQDETTGSCKGPTAGQMAFLIFGFGFQVIGASGIRPCNLAFGADQFNPKSSSGKRAISSFFNWYYFTYTFAMMVSLTVIVYVQSDVSWSLGLAIPMLMMFLSCAFFFIGTKLYVKVKPEGSPITGVVQVIVAAIKKRHLKLPEQQPWVSLFNHIPTKSINSKLQFTEHFRFLNKAAIETEADQINKDGSAANPWRLCSLQRVEEVKCLFRLLPIWVAGIFYCVVLIQQQNYAVFQALQTDRKLYGFNVPAASYVVFQMMSFTIWIPIYDRIIVPFLRKRTKNPEGMSLLRRMGIGLALSIAAMFVSAFVEQKRRALALTKPALGHDFRNGAISSMSGMWLVPQLALSGLSEAFFLIGETELFYKQVPENMRSIGGSMVFCGMAMSGYFSSFLSSVVHRTTEGARTGNWLAEDLNKGRLDYYYYLVAGLEVVNLGYFLVCAKWFKYKKTHNEDDHEEEIQSDYKAVV